MKLLRHETITAAKVTATNLVESATAWSGGTTYAAGALASVAGAAGLVTIYESLQASNLNHSPASSPSWWQAVQTSYAEYAGGTTYAAGDRVIVAASDKEYVSAQGSNTGHAVTDTAWWIEVGPTAPWRPFDALIQTQAERLDEINYTIEATGLVDTVVLLNISAASAQVIVTDATDGVVYDETVSLVSTSGIDNWAAYFRDPIRRRRDYPFDDLPAYRAPEIQVVLEDAGETVGLGALVIGRGVELGGTQYGGQVGIQDYSRKAQDDFGNYEVVERAYARRGQFNVNVPNTRLDAVADLLTEYRATPAVYIAAAAYGATVIYGFAKDWALAVQYPTYSILSISIEGLT